MSPAGTSADHAEEYVSNVSHVAQSPANGAQVEAAAGPSQPRPRSSASPQPSIAPKVKRRRMEQELAFSSPGPAFQAQQLDNESTHDSDASGGRARRPRRSTTLVNGNKSALTNGDGDNNKSFRRRRSSVAAREVSSAEATPADPTTLTSEPHSNSTSIDPPLRVASRQSQSPDRARSTSRSAAHLDLDSDSASASGSAHLPDEQEQALALTLPPARPPKPQITPLANGDADDLSGVLTRRKKEKLALAQSDLEDVHDGHDMLVRELFHLTKFVTMVGYDPHVAREDQSDVFTTFKNAHDLSFSLDDSGAGAQASTSARVTRRRVNARMESLSLKRPQPSSTPPTPASTTPKTESKIRRSESARARRSSSIRASVGVEGDSDKDGDDDVSDGSVIEDTPRTKKGTGRAKSGEGRPKSITNKRQRLLSEEPSTDSPSKRKGPRKGKALDELDAFILRQRPRPLPDHPPPLHILAPHQVPALRRFGGNIDALLQSFNLLHEGEGARDDKALEDADLQTYIKLDQRWRSGLPMQPQAGSTSRHVAHKTPRNKSHHDHLLEAMSVQYSHMRHSARHKQQNSRKVARMVAQHWERQLGTSEREKKAEERRVRALAKWTLKEVLKQWRLAVNVVRARKTAVEKAQKDKMDKEQLNAILEQSTAMLKKQHEVMTRADSLLDSDDESTRTSYGSDGTPEPEDESEVEEENDFEDAADVEETPQDSVSVIRDPSISSTPALEELNDQATSSPAPQAPIVNGDTSTASSPAPQEKRTSRRSVSGAKATTSKAQDSSLDPGDVDFAVGADTDEQEDAELERQMWDEDEEDDSEDAGLAADADIPIEELLKRYGYGQEADQAASEDAASDEEQVQRPALEVEAADMDVDTSIKEEEDDAVEIDESPASNALIREIDDDHSDTESAATSGRRSDSRRSLTRASSILSASSLRPAPRSRQPFLLRGQLRPYQQIGFEWLASLYANNVNGILADEMGLGKTIQTISLLAHLACDKGVWGPHLVVAPTSVMLNWEVEFKKFLPGFKILSYYGSQKERKEKRVGWNTENSFNVCITSYQLVLADQHIFRRKPWVYLVLDEAHHIKNFRSQRWQTLLGFNSQRRLLLTGTPLQNNLMDLWSLMYFLMPHGVTELPGGGAFANMKDFQDWFSNPLDKAIEHQGSAMNEETRAMVAKLHAVLRPYLLRRLKSEVEKELPSKYEHVITCKLSKRQRFLYNDFMGRAKTRESLASGNYLSIINCLMQLRKVCNHPDLFEVRPIVTSFAMSRSAVADYEVKELLVRRELLKEDIWDRVDLSVTNFKITDREQHLTAIESRDLRRLNASKKLPYFKDDVPEKEQLDTWTVDGFAKSREQRRKVDKMEKWKHLAYLNQYRCTRKPIYGSGLISLLHSAGAATRLEPLSEVEGDTKRFLDRNDNLLRLVSSRSTRLERMQSTIDRFAFVTPRAVAVDMPRWALSGLEPYQLPEMTKPEFDSVHPVAVKLHIAFPDASLLQYDCGKLQQLDLLMRRLKATSSRILIFTQMTRVLDILESFLNYHGYRYLRLDGATKVESRQALTEKFNRDTRISAFILSTRSGGLGINLTGADTVLFYDLDWNAAIEAQCMDRAHRIGQTRDVHIYRFVSEGTVEENMLRKANQKRLLDKVVIGEGEFTTEGMVKRGNIDWRDMLDDSGKLEGVEVGNTEGEEGGREVERAFLEAEDEEDRAAAVAAREEMFVDDGEFGEDGVQQQPDSKTPEVVVEEEAEEEEEEGGTIDDYMLSFVEREWEFFA